MNEYYTEQIKEVLEDTQADLINIKIKSFMGEKETKVLTIPKKYIIALYNDLLIDGVGKYE